MPSALTVHFVKTVDSLKKKKGGISPSSIYDMTLRDLIGVSSSMSEALMYAVWASVTFSEAQVSSISSCRTCQLCVIDTVIEYDT